ncbi:MAG: ribosome small subunit-dependent GTPase A [Bacteroidales bacterium]
MNGLVIKNTGSWYSVKTDEGKMVECKIKGKFRLQGIRTTNPIAVGDRVKITLNQEGQAMIHEIEERQNYIIRRSTNLSKQAHILAANLDQAFLIITLKAPATTTVFIDRFLASAEAYRIPVEILINKSDALDQEEMEYSEAITNLYSSIGYPCHNISAKSGYNLDMVREKIKGRITLLSGHSGVGKSTLINALIPGLMIKTGEISQAHHQGMHTTTFSEMFETPEGGYIIDTPGIRGFGTVDFKKEEVSHFFPDIFKHSANCRFNNCRHINEPGCAVLDAVENHYISQSRYSSYISILNDEEEEKYR